MGALRVQLAGTVLSSHEGSGACIQAHLMNARELPCVGDHHPVAKLRNEVPVHLARVVLQSTCRSISSFVEGGTSWPAPRPLRPRLGFWPGGRLRPAAQRCPGPA